MAEFVCKVGDTTGRIFQHLETAQTEEEARQKLSERGLYVFSVQANLDFLSSFTRARSERKIRLNDFLMFNQQFNTLVKAGLPILRSLDLLAERAGAPRLRPILGDVRQRVRDGALLSEALVGQGSFPPVYVTAISAGERSGNLSGVLEQYISYLKVSTGFKSKLVTTMIYPAILLVAVFLVLSYIVTFALPRFAELYKDLDVQLPATTRFMLAIAEPLRDYAFVLLGVLALGAMAIFVWTRTEKGALAIDRLKPKLPVLGDVWLKAQIAQFARTLATLLSGGTPLVAALHTASAAIDSRLISTSVEKAAERVKEGESLHASLAQTGLVPDLALEMIEVGEASGALSPMLVSVAEFYEEEVNTTLQRTLIWVQPAILAVMAVVVFFVMVSLYMPLFSLQVGSGG
jgi:type IV pilus assembly protein PilC